ncbi:hypothetical protein P9273_14340 [Mesorhizobium sp. WSM4935]|uniref:hypothetical protein n=1 Tax=Mesorhizobium sp. WSM4935 TaxID=3038547 RepID=UPI002414ED50|nr:hypothetical protein [Mesorhizobium sp. WSM4935]MDG4876278.1 hypothetical protein [Mesorhizobium sp. WSM4935]
MPPITVREPEARAAIAHEARHLDNADEPAEHVITLEHLTGAVDLAGFQAIGRP